MPHFVDAAHRQRQMPQHTEAAPSGQLQHLLQIGVYHGVVIGIVPVVCDKKQIKPAVCVPGHMHRADHEIQLRRAVHHVSGAVQIQIGLAQLNAQLQGNPAIQLPAGGGIRLLQRRPIVWRFPRRHRAPLHRFHMVGKADLIQAAAHALLRHPGHGQVSIRRAGGVYMIISQIHQRFLKKLLCFS